MKVSILLTAIFITIAFTATAQQAAIPGPHLIVYKTKKNYSKMVPVILSEDRTRIVSYPDPTDIKKQGKSQVPTSLHCHYLLDNKGIGVNTAFLDMKYTRYAKLKSAPTMDAMNKMIHERNPLTALYDCGLKSAYKNPAIEMNRIIRDGLLEKNCKSILQKQ